MFTKTFKSSFKIQCVGIIAYYVSMEVLKVRKVGIVTTYTYTISYLLYTYCLRFFNKLNSSAQLAPVQIVKGPLFQIHFLQLFPAKILVFSISFFLLVSLPFYQIRGTKRFS
uniref:Uncharacterized protein n=1 Tax=Cacopsylla melanoneura TaxID=428564 RepID=A0A8D8QV90_9HEMI